MCTHYLVKHNNAKLWLNVAVVNSIFLSGSKIFKCSTITIVFVFHNCANSPTIFFLILLKMHDASSWWNKSDLQLVSHFILGARSSPMTAGDYRNLWHLNLTESFFHITKGPSLTDNSFSILVPLWLFRMQQYFNGVFVFYAKNRNNCLRRLPIQAPTLLYRAAWGHRGQRYTWGKTGRM